MHRSAASPSDVLYAFGDFILDPVVGRLHAGDDEVSLTRKTFGVLVVLVERHGEVVDKDELFREVWPDTIVEENNLARCVSMLRKALREHGASDELILTVAGRGYSFAGKVAKTTRSALGTLKEPPPVAPRPPEVEPAPAPDSAAPPNHRATTRRWGIPSLAAAAVALAAFVSINREPPLESAADEATVLWRLTSAGTLESEPTWSPDGRFIAYSSDRSGNPDIWLQATSDDVQPVRLTSDAARDWQPAWSPDGLRVAFRSERRGGGIWVSEVVGGKEFKLSDGGFLPQWSPDGRHLLIQNSGRGPRLSASIIDAETGALVHSLRHDHIYATRVRWHPRGVGLTMLRVHRAEGPSFWSLGIDGTAAPLAVAPAVAARLEQSGILVRDFVWAPDGSAMFLTGRVNDTDNIWVVDADPSSGALIDGPTRLTTGPGQQQGVSISPDGARLAFTSVVSTTQGWLLPFDSVEGRILGDGEPVTPGGTDAEVLDLAANGQLVYRTSRRNQDELWLGGTASTGLLSAERDGIIEQPRWSRDGTMVAYFRRSADPGIVVVDTRAQDQRRVIRTAGTFNLFEWTNDAGGMLVGCRGEGPAAKPAICETALSSHGEAHASRVVASSDELSLYQARISPDGHWVSFNGTNSEGHSTIYVMPRHGGEWLAITEGRHYDDKPRWAPDGRTLYFLSLRDGFWNLWGRRVDSATGRPDGEPFQVSRFYSAARTIEFDRALQIGVSVDQLLLPLTSTNGAVWIMELKGRRPGAS